MSDSGKGPSQDGELAEINILITNIIDHGRPGKRRTMAQGRDGPVQFSIYI